MILNSPYISGSLTVTGNIISSGSITISGSIASASFATTSSFATTASYSVSSSYALSGSYSFNATTASNSLTASSADNFVVRQNVTASNMLATGRITAQTLVVQTVTSSIVYSSGSNIFGNLPSDVQQFTGSLRITGSGNHWIIGGSVGINTTSPDPFGRGDALNVGISATGASDNMALSLNAGASGGRGSQLYMGQGGCRHFTLSSNSTETTIGTVTNTPFRINTCDTTRLYVSSSTGNIGIGTTCPTYHLEVRCAASVASCYYAAMFARSTGANDGVGDIIAFGANGVTSIGGIYRAGASSWGIELQTANGNTRMRIDNTGVSTFCCQVCAPSFIGGTISGTTGTFSSSVTATSTIVSSGGEDGSAGPVMRLTSTNSNAGARNWAIINTWDNFGDLTFRVSNAKDGNALCAGTSIMALLRTGNIGIGTTSPSAPLTIRCDSSSTAALIEVATCAAGSYRYISMNAGSGISYCIPSGTSQSPYIEVQGGYPLVGGGSFKIRTGAMGSVADRVVITQDGIACFACQVCAPILTAYKRLGRPYSQTSSSGGTSIIDTSINNSDFGDGAIWSIAWGGNPNAAGSNYFSSKFGYIGIYTGYNGNVIKTINYTQVANFENVGTLCLFPFFWDGTTECTTVCNNYTGCIRFKICGYNSSYPGVNQQVYLTKLIS